MLFFWTKTRQSTCSCYWKDRFMLFQNKNLKIIQTHTKQIKPHNRFRCHYRSRWDFERSNDLFRIILFHTCNDNGRYPRKNKEWKHHSMIPNGAFESPDTKSESEKRTRCETTASGIKIRNRKRWREDSNEIINGSCFFDTFGDWNIYIIIIYKLFSARHYWKIYIRKM